MSTNFDSGAVPLHGLRHPETATTTGWYVWAGDYSEDPNFFSPVHLKHFAESHPELVQYLGLAPGWRFLVDLDSGYEDVWCDTSLLEADEL